MTPKKIIGIIYKHHHEPAALEARGLAQWLKKQKIQVFLESIAPTKTPGHEELSSIPKNTDWIVVLGGDGTLLGAARKIGKLGIPILGVNLGGLGFLTEIPLQSLYPVMKQLLKGQLKIENRLMLEAKVYQKKSMSRFHVLNDVVINKGSLARIIDLKVSINDHWLTTFRSDGLIISTPTGSTAYNLSAGGPILYPTLGNIIVTPICPFTLTNRPIILPDHDLISITLGKESEEKVSLTFDGQVGIDFHYGDKVTIKKSKKKIRLIRSPYQTYFEILQTKLMWGGATYHHKNANR